MYKSSDSSELKEVGIYLTSEIHYCADCHLETISICITNHIES